MRGTFVFPCADTDFLQLLELRANNGAQADVETVFVLTGDTYYVPTQLIALDDPAIYHTATRSTVQLTDQAAATTVATWYAERDGPNLIAVVHTHPDGGTTPSQADREWGPSLKRDFDQHFDNYEFFFGIHALQDACDPDSAWLRCPVQTDDHILAWWGENRKHALAIYDQNGEPCPVVIR